MVKYSEAGKGDGMRKANDNAAYDANFTKIFGAVGPLERKKREEALRKLTELSEEMGLYDVPSERDSSRF